MSEENKTEETLENAEGAKEKGRKFCFEITVPLLIGVLVAIFILEFLLALPYKNKEFGLVCKYKSTFHKIECVQTGDVVPDWFLIDETKATLGGYSMALVMKKNEAHYEVLKMSDKFFVPGLRRRIVYELKDKTLMDYVRFKAFAKKAKLTNWGSAAFYCSEANVKEPICAAMKSLTKK